MQNQINKNLIEQLNNKLFECMNENKTVAIHIHIGKITTRVTIIPEIFNITENEFQLEYKSFHLNIAHGIDYIEYIAQGMDYTEYDNYEYDSYYIQIGEIEMFFDFI